MAILDRFRTQARHKHPDAAVRLAFVQELPLDERELIAEIAREDADARVRRAAVSKLMDPAALAALAAAVGTSVERTANVSVPRKPVTPFPCVISCPVASIKPEAKSRTS